MKSVGELAEDIDIDIHITRTKDKLHGDFASNIALKLSKQAGISARDLAKKILSKIPADPAISKIEIAGPGFLNFYLYGNHQADVLNKILSQRERFWANKCKFRKENSDRVCLCKPYWSFACWSRPRCCLRRNNCKPT